MAADPVIRHCRCLLILGNVSAFAIISQFFNTRAPDGILMRKLCGSQMTSSYDMESIELSAS